MDIFEDVADPADWEEPLSVEEETNSRVDHIIDNLSGIPIEHRVGGPGATRVMGPFVHCSPKRPGRFSDGTFGVYHACDKIEVAIAETIHHHAKFMSVTKETPGWTSRFRELIGSVDDDLDEIAGRTDLLDPDDCGPSQIFAAERRAAGSKGLT